MNFKLQWLELGIGIYKYGFISVELGTVYK